MKKLLIFLVAAAFVSIEGQAIAKKPSPCDNFGALTSYAIHKLEDYNQGQHASDPSDDGKGPEERVGLPNLLGRGDLQSTLDLLVELLNPDCDCQ